MDIERVLQISTAVIVAFSHKCNLAEYEALAYEQACRSSETILKLYREVLEGQIIKNS